MHTKLARWVIYIWMCAGLIASAHATKIDPVRGKPLDGVIDPEFIPTADWETGKFMSQSGGHTIRYAYLPAIGVPHGTIVIQGGLSEFAEKYFHNMRVLQTWGYDSWSMDWRGQGKSDRYTDDVPPRLVFQGYANDAADLIQFTETLVNRRSDGPLVLIAHSMGGQISIEVLHMRPDLFDRAVLSTPMFGINTGSAPLWFVKMFASTMTFFGQERKYVFGYGPWSPDTPYDLTMSKTSHHPVRYIMGQDWYVRDPELIAGSLTWGWLNNAFESQNRTYSQSYMSKITTPLLIASVGNDDYVISELHAPACKNWLPDCALYEVPEAKHELFQEIDKFRRPWFARIKAFIEE